MKWTKVALLSAVILCVVLVPALGFCSVESTLTAIQSRLINVILPLAGILGLCFSAFSFFTGNPAARQHLWMSIIGAVVSFGAPSIIAFIRGLVN
jgi:hypothetical protein